MTSQPSTTRSAAATAILAAPGPTMLALVQERYGSPDMLAVAPVPTPTPGSGEVLVHMRASSVNARDWHIMRGEPRLARLLDRSTFGRHGPKVAIRGTDFAGVVAAVGTQVTLYRPGDPVFGEADAAIAQYVAAPEHSIGPMPAGMTFEHAAALPLAGNTALMLLRAAEPVAGQSMLINGASGGVGTFAVQLATSMGLRVTAVCSPRNAELARSLGAVEVIDYTRENFVAVAKPHDVVVDLVGNRPLRALGQVTAAGGTLVLSGGGVSGEGRYVGPLWMLLKAQLAGRLSRHHRIVTPQAKPDASNLAELAELVTSRSITPVLDRTFALRDAAEAIRYLETAHARAKVVITQE